MSMLDSVTKDKRKLLAAVVLILALAAFVRFYHIGWSFSSNGIDEGIMLQRSQLVHDGYMLYTDIPCDQAPLAFLIGALLEGDPVALRYLEAGLSVLAIAFCMETARRIKGNSAMLLTGVLLAIDFAFLRESRLFSLNGLSSFFLAYSMLFFVLYLQKHSRLALVAAGALVGLSTATKLFGGLGLLGMIVFLVLEMRGKREERLRRGADILLLAVVAAVPMVRLMFYFGPSEMLDGMVFDQGHRSFDLFMKLSLPIYFGLNLAYALPLVRARMMWKAGPEVRFLIVVSAVILAFMIFQPLVFFHHLAFMSPGFAILAGVFLAGTIESKKDSQNVEHIPISGKRGCALGQVFCAILLAGLLVSAGLAAYGLGAQRENWQVAYGEKIAEITDPDDWIISGDPLVAAFANRNAPPEMVNLAYRVYPDFTQGNIESAIADYDPAVVVICYRLNEFSLQDYLGDNGYELVANEWFGDYNKAVLEFPQDPYGPVWVFVRADIVSAHGLPTQGWEL
ncbi:MAG: glycosyltransferase family 39 protein [Thermoplasmata archaeon]|nr:glycosyltransferase family 39 protein [Thermoplasmata archaeon]